MSFLGLSDIKDHVSSSMISSADTLPDYTIEKVFGIVEGLSERSFPAVGIGGVGIYKGGELDKLFEEAKEQMARKAAASGAIRTVTCDGSASGAAWRST